MNKHNDLLRIANRLEDNSDAFRADLVILVLALVTIGAWRIFS